MQKKKWKNLKEYFRDYKLITSYSKYTYMYREFKLCDLIVEYIPSFLPLGATAQDELWPPEQPASIPP
jgi:hypothetical protein